MGSVTMIHLTFKHLLLPFLLLLSAVNGVRIKNFSIPDLGYVGESVELLCDFEMTEENETLEYVYWYKGIPHNNRLPIMAFDPNNAREPILLPGVGDYELAEVAEGVNIDVMQSNQTSMTLTDLELLSKGRYACEVYTSHDSSAEYGCLNVTDQPELVSVPPPSISSEDMSTSTADGKQGTLENIVNEMKEMKERLKKTEEALTELNTTLHKDPPYMFVCGSHSSGFDYKKGPVTYGDTAYSSTNLETGGLNISTGVFTAGHPGIYSVSWTMVGYSRGPTNYVHLRKNNGMVWGSSANTANQGRTMYVHLDKGNTLSLYCSTRCDDVYGGTTLCISLVKSHEEPKKGGWKPANPKWCDYE